MVKKNILIFGAGSIGTHHANAARHLNCNVTICDINATKFEYMKEYLYPSRYKKWDRAINFIPLKDIFRTKNKYDLIIIGIPPKNHLMLLKKCIFYLRFKKLLIEKPLSVYNQNYSFIKNLISKNKLYCGFNHSLSNSIKCLFQQIKKNKIGSIHKVEINWNEDFNSILKAHPWIKNISSCYLSDINNGGGGAHEYSHAIHLALLFRKELLVNTTNTTYNINYKKINNSKYDSKTRVIFRDKCASVILNINTTSNPPQKNIKITGNDGEIFWERKIENGYEDVKINNGVIFKRRFKITRPDDFITQMKYLLDDTKKNSNLSNIKIESAIEVMDILKEMFKDAKKI